MLIIVSLNHKEIAAATTKASAGFPITVSGGNKRATSQNVLLESNDARLIGRFRNNLHKYITKKANDLFLIEISIVICV